MSSVNSEKPLKNTEIPILEQYSGDPGGRFWSKFPFNPLPDPFCPNSPIQPEIFERFHEQFAQDLDEAQNLYIGKSVADITYGADSLVALQNYILYLM